LNQTKENNMRLRHYFQFVLFVAVFWAASNFLIAEVTVVEGEIGPGAHYGFYVPDNWNGDVVFFAHGLVDPNSPIELGPHGSMSEPLLELGYAFAISSYSENGYAVKRGAQQTHQLRGLFKSHFGNPRRSYLMGRSMGGGVVIPLVETYPKQYDGALTLCGINGGTVHQMNHVFDFRVLFDYFYPGVLPDEPLSIPEGTDFMTEIMPLGFYALTMPATAMEFLGVDQLEVEIVNPAAELAPAMLFNLYGYSAWAQDFPNRVNGQSFFDNLATEYSGSSDDATLNATVERFGPASPKAKNYMRHHFQPTGELEIPLVTLHNARDPLVPISHEVIYAELVTKAAASDMLLQRTSETFGHCVFTEDEWLGAFIDLVNWVETGVKPSP
jgi:pimeloyl-ACP methyl ester carboxylesterase